MGMGLRPGFAAGAVPLLRERSQNETEKRRESVWGRASLGL